jgi:hypothetical protein
MKTNTEKAIKILENLLASKQRNGTIKNIDEEIIFLCGGIAMVHELTKHNNKNSDAMECYPPKYFLSMCRSESINNFKYRKRG